MLSSWPTAEHTAAGSGSDPISTLLYGALPGIQ